MWLLILACAPASVPSGGWTDTGVAPLVDDQETVGTVAAVVINELMADNESTVQDELGHQVDWIELVATAEADVDLSGWALWHEEEEWLLPAGSTLGPGEHLVLWADGGESEGPLHLPWTLDEDGDTVALFDAEGQVADRWDFDAQPADVVLARFPDGGPFIASSILSTPGNANPLDPGQSTDPSDLLFPQDEVLVIELGLPPASIAALSADSSTYVEGSVSFGAVTLSPVGIRIKGQWGSLRDLDQKAAFKVNMGSFGRSGELLGLEKLTLNNMVQDPSLVHERLAYQLFTDLGVPAPRTAHVALYLNGEYRGIYLHVESPDERFLARWYDNPEGNLYEGEYGQDLTLDSYLELDHDERGSDDPDDYSDLAALAALLDEEPSEERAAELETLLDVDEWLAAMAGEVVIGHWDGYFWYPNNYRVYHDPDSGRLSLLPWGVDQTFDYEGDLEDASGAVAEWMLAVPSLWARYRRALWRAAERMEALGLDDDAEQAHAMVLPYLATGPYEEHSVGTSRSYLRSTVAYVQERPGQIVETLSP